MSSYFYYAAYNVNIWLKEMMTKFGVEPVAKGSLEGYDLEFRGFPSIKPCLGAKVPVVVYRLSEKFRHKLNYDELVNLFDCVPVTLNIRFDALTGNGLKLDVPRDTLSAVVYISREFRPLERLPLTLYHVMFNEYQELGFPTELLLKAALEADTQYSESEINKFELWQDQLKKQGLNQEESEILYYNLIARMIVNPNQVKIQPNPEHWRN